QPPGAARAVHGLLGQGDHLVGVLRGVQIGAADAARLGLHEHLAFADHRLRHVVDEHLPAPQDRCFHDDDSCFSSACFWMACMMAAPAPPMSSARLATAQSRDSTSVRAESCMAGITLLANSS